MLQARDLTKLSNIMSSFYLRSFVGLSLLVASGLTTGLQLTAFEDESVTFNVTLDGQTSGEGGCLRRNNPAFSFYFNSSGCFPVKDSLTFGTDFLVYCGEGSLISITLLDVQLDDEGEWKCRTFQVYQTFYLHILVSVKNVSIDITHMDDIKNKTLTLNETNVLSGTCTSSFSTPLANLSLHIGETEENIIYLNNTMPPKNQSNLLQATASFVVQVTRFMSHLQVFCAATNGRGKVNSSGIAIVVQYKPDRPWTDAEQGMYKVIIGDVVRINCSSRNGNPVPTEKWMCNPEAGFPAYPNNTLAVTSSRELTKCTCFSTNLLGSNSTEIIIDVLYPPSTPVVVMNSYNVVEVLSVVENRSINLTCISQSNPLSIIYWTAPSFNIYNSTDNLMLRKIRIEQNGSIECRAENEMTSIDKESKRGENKSSICLNVLYPPKHITLTYIYNERNITISSSDIFIVNETSFRIVCSAQSNPPAEYKWNGNVNFPNLTINSITHNLTRTCTAMNNMTESFGNTTTGLAEKTIVLHVLFAPSKPEIQLTKNSTPVDEILRIKENSTVDVICKTTSYPKSNISWIYCHNITTNGEILSFNKTSAGIRCNISCSANNEMTPSFGNTIFGNNSRTVAVDVLYSPRNFKVIFFSDAINGSSPIQIAVRRDSSFRLQCTAEANPSPNCTWNGLATDTLNISSIRTDSAYTCIAKNIMTETSGNSTPGSESVTIFLNVLYEPTAPVFVVNSKELNTNVTALENGTLSILCKVDSSPPANVSWNYYNARNIVGDTLHLANITRCTYCTIKCMVENHLKPTFGNPTIGKNDSSIQLEVLYPPEVWNNGTVKREEGKNLELSCFRDNGKTSTNSAFWKYPNNTQAQNGSTLIMSKIDRTLTGKYSCHVNYTMIASDGKSQNGSKEDSVYLDVLYKAEIKQFGVLRGSSLSRYVNENNTFDMVCIVTSNPTSTLSLHTNGRLIREINNTRTVNNSKTASCNDTGTYFCSGYNYLNRGNYSWAQLDIFVNCGPRHALGVPLDQNLTSAQNISATFSLTIVSYPRPEVYWFKVNESGESEFKEGHMETFNNSLFETHVKFTINNVNEGKYGQYIMVANNSFGSYRQQLYLVPEGKPNPPIAFNVTADSTTENSVTLWWEPGFDGGLPQKFLISFYEVLDAKWFNHTDLQDTGETVMTETINKLKDGTTYIFQLCAFNEKGSTMFPGLINVTTKVRPKQPYESVVAAAVGGTVGSLIAVLIVVGVIIFLQKRGKAFYKRKQPEKESAHVYQNVAILPDAKYDDLPPIPPEEIASPTDFSSDNTHLVEDENPYLNQIELTCNFNRIAIAELVEYVSSRQTEALYTEFEDLPKGMDPRIPYYAAQKSENAPLNRYQGVYPYDHSRVVISNQPTFFINANYIDGFHKKNAYIASLGPTIRHTAGFETFWSMIWNEESDVIVMLTNLMEPSGMKCEKYWAESGTSRTIGNFILQSKKEKVTAEYTVRTLLLSRHNDPKVRTITQLHFTAWPDKKVPGDVTSLIEFRQQVKATPTRSAGPLVVHCSAGIGRTGTYIALDRLIDEGKSIDSVNVKDCVLNMRKQRVNMIQTPDQYVYLHQALVYCLAFDIEPVTAETIGEYVNTTNNNVYNTLYQQLNQTLEIDPSEETDARASNGQLVEKNRRRADIPGDKNRVRLHLDKEMGESDYINAVYFNGFLPHEHFVLAQSPLPKTVEDFFALLYQETCSCIVSLDDYGQKGTNNQSYLPEENQQKSYGLVTISCLSVNIQATYTVRKLKIAHAGKFETGERIVNHVQLTTWKHDEKVPKDPTLFIKFVRDVTQYADHISNDSFCVVVHCMTGSERSGLFCAVSNMLQKMELERQVSIVNTLRQIRARRKTAIPNMEQLKFCYQALNAFVSMRNF